MTKKGSRLYRYYVSMDVIRNRDSDAATGPQRLPAGLVEGAVIQEIRTLVRTPEIVAKTIAAVRQQAPELNERDVIAALNDFDALWGSLFPAEQARIHASWFSGSVCRLKGLRSISEPKGSARSSAK